MHMDACCMAEQREIGFLPRVARRPVFDRTVRLFFAICPIKKIGLNRTMSCLVFRPLLKLLMKSAFYRNLVFIYS
jgi:hypothetical protein